MSSPRRRVGCNRGPADTFDGRHSSRSTARVAIPCLSAQRPGGSPAARKRQPLQGL